MNNCILCGNELLTGDIHWQSGMCNECWNEHYAVKGAVPLDKFYSELYIDLLKNYRKLEQQLAEKNKKIEELKNKVEQLENKLEHYSNDKWYISLEKLNIPEEIENQIKKQVCNEIKKGIGDLFELDFNLKENEFQVITFYGIKQVLNKIEKAEDSKEDNILKTAEDILKEHKKAFKKLGE